MMLLVVFSKTHLRSQFVMIDMVCNIFNTYEGINLTGLLVRNGTLL